MKNFLALLCFFLFCGTAIASPNDDLIRMAKNGYEDDLKDLLSRWDDTADINYQDADGNTALHYAAKNNNVGIMNIVMNAYPFSAGIKYNLKNKNGETVFLVAVRYCADCVEGMLSQVRSKIDIEAGPITPLVAALIDLNDKMAERLILAGANLGAKVKFSGGGEGPILILLAGDIKLHRALLAYLKQNGKVNLRFDGQETPVMVADIGNMKDLLDHGALLNLRDMKGNTALHLSALQLTDNEYRNERASERYAYLVTLGAKTDLLNEKQHTAAQILESRRRFFANLTKLRQLLNAMHDANPEANTYWTDTGSTHMDFRYLNKAENITYVSTGYDLSASTGPKIDPSALTFRMFDKYQFKASALSEVGAVRDAMDNIEKSGPFLD